MQFTSPTDIVLHYETGTLFFVARGSRKIFMVTGDKQISEFAGAGWGHGPFTDDGIGEHAAFRGPQCLTINQRTGFLYVTDQESRMIRVINPKRRVSTFRFSYVDGVKMQESYEILAWPTGIVLHEAIDTLYVANTGKANIIKIPPGILAAPLSFVNCETDSRIFVNPVAITIDPRSGTLYLSDQHAIYIITPDRRIALFAGHPEESGIANGFGAEARFNNPSGLAFDFLTGILWVSDTGNHTIRMILPNRQVITIAGLAGQRGNRNGPGPYARFHEPMGLTFDPRTMNLYVADYYNNQIRELTFKKFGSPETEVSTFVKSN